uniref:Uncharacterized protein n=1 Tax=Ditylenchus dipsaci TaxID=166011 RepID=A0A915D3A3_9BILA
MTVRNNERCIIYKAGLPPCTTFHPPSHIVVASLFALDLASHIYSSNAQSATRGAHQTSNEKLDKLVPFKEIDSNGTRMSEEVHGVETFERNIHDTTPPQSKQDNNNQINNEYSCNTFTERRTYGCDENGEMTIQIDQQPSQRVSPVEPVRPITPITDQAHISRLGIHSGKSGNHPTTKSFMVELAETEEHSTQPSELGKQQDFADHSNNYNERSAGFQNGSAGVRSSARSSQRPSSSLSSASSNARSASSSAASSTGIMLSSAAGSVPLKKVTRKSRLVSIHDGRPVSPFVESVHYEPLHPRPASSSLSSPRRQTRFEENISYSHHNNDKNNHLYADQQQKSRRSEFSHVLQEDDYVTQNPFAKSQIPKGYNWLLVFLVVSARSPHLQELPMRRNQVSIVNCPIIPSRPPIVVATTVSSNTKSLSTRKQQTPKKGVLKRNSDPIQLKQAVHQFLHNHWNVEPKIRRKVTGGWQATRRRPFSGGTNRPNLNRTSPNCSVIKRSASVTDLSQVRISLDTLSLEGPAKQMQKSLETSREELRRGFATHLDLTRMRLKVEKRIERRRSLTLANNQLHNQMANAKSNAVVDKYSTKLYKGRRALSDLALDCMELNTHLNIEELKNFHRKGNSGYNAIAIDSLALSRARTHCKRVSFSAPTTTIYVPRNKSSPNLETITYLQQKPQLFTHFQHSQRVQRIQPILTRRSRRLSANPLGACSNKPTRAHPSIVVTTTIGADYSSADDYPLSHMDFATFKAWRRGSRLSIDVLDMFYMDVEKSNANGRQQQASSIQSIQVQGNANDAGATNPIPNHDNHTILANNNRFGVVRDRLFHVMLVKVAISYSRYVSYFWRRVIEFSVLVMAISLLGLLIYEGVVRVEVIQNLEEFHRLQAKAQKESSRLPEDYYTHFDLRQIFVRGPIALPKELKTKHQNSNPLQPSNKPGTARKANEEVVEESPFEGKPTANSSSLAGYVHSLLAFFYQPIDLNFNELDSDGIVSGREAVPVIEDQIEQLEELEKRFGVDSNAPEPAFAYVVEYSLHYGLLKLSPSMRQEYAIPSMLVQLDSESDECFGDWKSKFLMRYLTGFEDIIMSSVRSLAENETEKGYLRDMISGEHYHFISMGISRVSYLTALLVMLIFTFAISMLLRFSHHQIFLFIVDLLQMFELNQPLVFQ